MMKKDKIQPGTLYTWLKTRCGLMMKKDKIQQKVMKSTKEMVVV